MRQQQPLECRFARFGAFQADLQERTLTKAGGRVHLQEQPFRILTLLLERPCELVTREEIRDQVWPPDTLVGFDAALNTAIRKLREALNDSAENSRFLETVPRQGYRFLAPVSWSPEESSAIPTTRPMSRLPYLVATLTLAGAVIVAFWCLRRRHNRSRGLC
jgi:DNA-binding winged helix-turn-helix (wHTH) protein